jgi:DNA (cytosine-5)-methyltransferase 1
MTHFLDLFSGIGGFALGAYWAGLRFDNHYYSEVDKYAIRVYQQRFPDAIGLGDICKISGRGLPAGDWIISGGFPCQDISVAGKGAGLAGARSGLWFEMLRLIGDLRPRYTIVENVGALLVRGIDTVLGTLAEIGYDAEWQIISAASVGAPHRRDRVYIVAYPTSERWRNARKVVKRHVNKNSSKGWVVEYRRGTSGRVFSMPDAGVFGVDDGIPNRMERLHALGNAIVPQCAEVIFNQPAFDEWRHA